MSSTIQKPAESTVIERYKALFRVSQTLISIHSSEELFSILARELRAVVNFYVMGVGIYDEKAHEMDTKSYGEPGLPLQAPKFAPEETFSWWVYQHQQPLIIPSLDAEARFPAVAEMLKNRGVRSVCALPLTTVHRRLGGLAVGSTEVDAYSIEEVSFLSLVANQVALAVDDALNFDASQNATEALRASEQSLRLIVDSIPGLVATMNTAGEFQLFNRQLLEYFGKTPEELKGWATNDVIHPDDLPRVIAAFKSSIETGHPYDIEHRCRRADGVYRWTQGRALPVLDTEGRIISWYLLFTDIDTRKQAEDRLQLLFDITNQVVSNLQLRDLLRAVSGNIRRVMHCDCASLALPREENKQLQLYVLDFPESKGFLHEEGVYSMEGSPYGTAFRTMKPLALESPFSSWLNDPVVKSRVSEGFTSLCFLPLIRRNRAIGTLNLGRLRGDAFTREELDFLGQVASQIAIAVENTSAYQEVTEARAELEKAFQEIHRLKDRLQDENLALREQINEALMFEEVVGTSPALQTLLARVSKVAPTDSTVLLTGETGTGKELIARAIHKRSLRSSRAFVSVNCAAIPASLIASELFGHEIGAFTGAVQRRLGRFELAEEGTLFLDEVGELPAETQITLLRVLQEREFERVGGNQHIRANVRVIAATNRDLEAAIAAGTFRSDLFYRLNVFPIEIPPLRERREDIPLLVEYFIDQFARKAGKRFHGIKKKSMDLFLAYPWPGNIRELQNVVERSVIVSETENFSVDESWLSRQPHASEAKSQLELSQKLAVQEKEIIEAALRESAGRVSGPSGAAAKLGIHRSTLESKIASLKIDKHLFKSTNTSTNR